MNDVILVLAIPAEYSENDKAKMRECTFNAGLISDKNSVRLQFTTEPTFMVVDCGGGTVDLTTRKLLEENQLSEVTERAGDLLNSQYVKMPFTGNDPNLRYEMYLKEIAPAFL
ncbi:hypothetical protein C1646_753831 [Rhizophagus diaphanus]|nr:hypothetical protein C1646_753831 [Rhizophagus diaphanus] [Rhizophagus sp. MUCL 43196]